MKKQDKIKLYELNKIKECLINTNESVPEESRKIHRCMMLTVDQLINSCFALSFFQIAKGEKKRVVEEVGVNELRGYIEKLVAKNFSRVDFEIYKKSCLYWRL